MSDVSGGPGWWEASDGKWYPPEAVPGDRPAPTQAPTPGFGPPAGQPYSASLEGKSFIRSLFDFSFSSFVTLRVIRVLYVLITVLYTLVALAVFISLLAQHTAGSVVGAIIGVPIAYFIYLTIARISLEVLMVIFNIGKDVRRIRERGDTRI
jgi:hypothetical protein